MFCIKMSENSKEVKSHYIVPFSYVLAGMAFFNSYIYARTFHANTLALYCFIAGSVACLTLFIKKKVKSHYVTANFVIFLFFICISILTLYSGGISSNAIWWLATTPIVATFLLNAFFGLIWFIAVILNFLSIIYLGHHELLPLNVMLNAPDEGRIIVSFTMNALLITILCILADLIRDRAFADQDELRLNAFQLNQVASLGKMASGVAHEINNPLTVIKGSQLRITRMLNEKAEVDKMAIFHYMKKIEKNIQRIQKVTGLMRTISEQAQDRSISEININLLLEDVIKMLGRDIVKTAVHVEMVFPENIIIFKGIHAEIFQAFYNIVENAIEELMLKEGERAISIKLEQSEKKITVSIEDNGKDISTHIRDHLFDPFFTTKLGGEGEGLGLSFSLNVFVSNGGDLELLHDRGRTIFKATLPLSY